MNVPLFPTEASTVAGPVDTLVLVLLVLSLCFALGIAGLIVIFVVKYRRRADDEIPEATGGSHRLEFVFITVPLILALGVYYFATHLYLTMETPPPNTINIDIVAKQWMWLVQYPQGQQEIDQLHVPVGEPVRLTMISEDVIHDFYVPDFRLHQDVLPGRYTTLWFQADRVGTYHLFCSQYCGLNHASMTGWIYAMAPRDYEAWLTSGTSFNSAASRGAKLFQRLGCAECHREDSQSRAPNLEGLYGHPVLLQNGQTVTADDNYIRTKILDPNAQLPVGYQPIMPSFRGKVSETEIDELIAYIKSLGNVPPGLPPPGPPSGAILTPLAQTPTPEATP